MNRSIFYAGAMAIATTFAVACGSTSVNVNTSNMTNRAANAANTVSNTMANAGNTAANTVSNATGGSDTGFVQDAAIGGLSEVELGKMASTKAANAEVKKFGQMMVTDHTNANNELKALAQKKGWTLPAEPDSSHKATMEDLRNRVGADFDRAYVDEMVDDHEEDVAAFEAKAKNATDPDLKAFAEKTLPTLKKHLDAIKAIQAKMSSAPANK